MGADVYLSNQALSTKSRVPVGIQTQPGDELQTSKKAKLNLATYKMDTYFESLIDLRRQTANS